MAVAAGSESFGIGNAFRTQSRNNRYLTARTMSVVLVARIFFRILHCRLKRVMASNAIRGEKLIMESGHWPDGANIVGSPRRLSSESVSFPGVQQIPQNIFRV